MYHNTIQCLGSNTYHTSHPVVALAPKTAMQSKPHMVTKPQTLIDSQQMHNMAQQMIIMANHMTQEQVIFAIDDTNIMYHQVPSLQHNNTIRYIFRELCQAALLADAKKLCLHFSVSLDSKTSLLSTEYKLFPATNNTYQEQINTLLMRFTQHFPQHFESDALEKTLPQNSTVNNTLKQIIANNHMIPGRVTEHTLSLGGQSIGIIHMLLTTNKYNLWKKLAYIINSLKQAFHIPNQIHSILHAVCLIPRIIPCFTVSIVPIISLYIGYLTHETILYLLQIGENVLYKLMRQNIELAVVC